LEQQISAAEGAASTRVGTEAKFNQMIADRTVVLKKMVSGLLGRADCFVCEALCPCFRRRKVELQGQAISHD